MVSCFTTVSKDAILAVNEAAVPTNTTKDTKFGLLALTVVQTLDSAIHSINHYPADGVISFLNTYPLDSDLSNG